ncbi:MAG: hypothetical protein QXG10_05265 [Candidatus Hadarchaeales archaeon]
MTGKKDGSASIAVGALIAILSAIFSALTYMNFLPNQQWIFPWLTNYVICGMGLVVGLILLGYGVYHRNVVSGYARKMEELETRRMETEERLKQKEMELHFVKSRLHAAERKVEKKKRQLHRVSGRLGDRTRRLKEIERLARIRKKR